MYWTARSVAYLWAVHRVAHAHDEMRLDDFSSMLQGLFSVDVETSRRRARYEADCMGRGYVSRRDFVRYFEDILDDERWLLVSTAVQTFANIDGRPSPRGVVSRSDFVSYIAQAHVLSRVFDEIAEDGAEQITLAGFVRWAARTTPSSSPPPPPPPQVH